LDFCEKQRTSYGGHKSIVVK